MKVLQVLLIILLVSLYTSQYEPIKYCEDRYEPNNVSFCLNLNLTRPYDYDSKPYFKCCYIVQQYYEKGTFRNKTKCKGFSLEEYNYIDNIAKSFRQQIETFGGIIERIEYNCYSEYLHLSLLSIMLFLL